MTDCVQSLEAGRRSSRQRFDGIIRFIDANLDGDLSVATLAHLAQLSPFHFQRRFSASAGISVSCLVRLVRLSRASLRLVFCPNRSVTQIAFETGFNSSEAFSRAFRRTYGQAPSEFRRQPRWRIRDVTAALSRLQEIPLNTDVEIVDFPATRVAAVEYQGAPEDEYSAVMQLVAWRRENGVSPDKGRTYGIHYSDPAASSPDEYRIDVCVSYDGDIPENPHGVVSKTIPAGRCARIRHLGSREYIAEAEYIYRKWLPESGEALRDFPPFFHYVNVGPDVAEIDMITDVYLPIV